jgi:hypothetical protein
VGTVKDKLQEDAKKDGLIIVYNNQTATQVSSASSQSSSSTDVSNSQTA